MSTKSDFLNSLKASTQLLDMYKELRRSRDLGVRGRLDARNEDLLWLPRSAVVAALSAMDAYIHATVREKMAEVLSGQDFPEALSELMSELLPIKNKSTFHSTYKILKTSNTPELLSKLGHDKHLQFVSYQAPEKIIAGYSLINHRSVFEEVSAIWQGPKTGADEIKDRLSKYVRRRNQIAHEGDYEPSGTVRYMAPEYANECRVFIENLTLRFDRVVYGDR